MTSSELTLWFPMVAEDLDSLAKEVGEATGSVPEQFGELQAFVDDFDARYLSDLLAVDSPARRDSLIAEVQERTLRAFLNFAKFFEDHRLPLPTVGQEILLDHLRAALHRIRESGLDEVADELGAIPELLLELAHRSGAPWVVSETSKLSMTGVLLTVLDIDDSSAFGIVKKVILPMGSMMVVGGISAHFVRPDVTVRTVALLLSRLLDDLKLYTRLQRTVPAEIPTMQPAPWSRVESIVDATMEKYDEALRRLAQ